MTQAPLFKKNDIESITAEEVVKWTEGKYKDSQLFLPPIQRSVVWSNAQIINYWDSLLRGYPAGMMLAHRSRPMSRDGISEGVTAEGQTCIVPENSFHLFDGQQRITAILLGHQAGQLAGRIKLWVDLGLEPSPDSGLLFQLRANSTGQPFGYEAASPNQKLSISKRSAKIEEWKKENNTNRYDSREAFRGVHGKDLIDAKCAVPLSEVISFLLNNDSAKTVEKLELQYPNDRNRITRFVGALDEALKRPIVFQMIKQDIVEQENEYIRFFGRLGQGGTALSNDELTYSIIKHQYPKVRDRMKEIMEGPAGRIAGEVNLVLASLRVAKVSSTWTDDTPEWKIIGRPSPSFVSQLRDFPKVAQEFKTLLPVESGGKLMRLLENIRNNLAYDKNTNPTGIPVMLLARLPHQLVDVLILMQSKMDPEEMTGILPPFVLYWLLFVSDQDKAASMVYRRLSKDGSIVDHGLILELVNIFEKDGYSRVISLGKQLLSLREGIRKRGHRLSSWPERFSELDSDSTTRKSGDALRNISCNRELIKRALMWLQRENLTENFTNYDPTSNRDEDLPIDLDHLFPESKFGFDWRSRGTSIGFEDRDENFRWQRVVVGNSLGNFRWLGVSENRGRGNRLILLNRECDYIDDLDSWNNLITKTKWLEEDVATFQRLIDLRTVELYEKILVDSKIVNLFEDEFSGSCC